MEVAPSFSCAAEMGLADLAAAPAADEADLAAATAKIAPGAGGGLTDDHKDGAYAVRELLPLEEDGMAFGMHPDGFIPDGK